MKCRLRFLYGLMTGNRLRFLIASLCMIVSSLLIAVIPHVTQLYVDIIINHQEVEFSPYLHWVFKTISVQELRQYFWIVGLIIPGLGLLYLIFTWLYKYLSMSVGENVARRTREMVYEHILQLPISFFQTMTTGALISRCSTDTDEIQSLFSSILIDILKAVVLVMTYFIVMINIDPIMTLVTLMLMPILVVFGLVFYKKTRYSYTEYRTAGERQTEYLTQFIQGVRVVKAFGMQEKEIRRFDIHNNNLREKAEQREHVKSWYWPYYMALMLMQMALILIFGILRIQRGDTTVGVLIAFSSYSTLLFNALGIVGRSVSFLSFAEVAANRLDEILSIPVETADGEPRSISGDIVFRDVCFSAEGISILENLSFTVKEGQVVGILGTTGSGKSSLIQMLLRLQDPDRGTIQIGGVDICDISRFSLRDQIGCVLQEPYLFSRTVAENISMKTSKASETEILYAAQTACVHKDILGFSEGYDTVVGEKGATVSGGQKQRIAIAQALIRNCPVLVVDDSLSAVDAETEHKIIRTLLNVRNKCTVILISNKISVLKKMDLVLCMDDGKIVQQGHPVELANRDGLFRRILLLQTVGGQ